jgi:hypothetical protein
VLSGLIWTVAASASECTNWQTLQPAWIWCDDFEQDRLSSYFEYDNHNGFARTSGEGLNGSTGMKATYLPGDSSAGGMKLAFGHTPGPYFKPVGAGTQIYREVYWRAYLRNEAGWVGGAGDKLTRATVFANSNWAQAMIAHLWGDGEGASYLSLDPASGTDTAGNVQTTSYNDFGNFRWLGAQRGATAIFDSSLVGKWHCIEAHVKLNDAGQADGVFEFWIDDNLEGRETTLNWLGSYSGEGINAIFFENYWNAGSPVKQARYWDNIVVSIQRIGCAPSGGDTDPPTAPSNLTVQ